MSEFRTLSMTQLMHGYASKQFSVSEVISSYVNAMHAHRDLNAFITEMTEEHLMQCAREAQERINQNIALPYDGIPVAIKDLFCTKNVRTTAGSHILSNFVPSYTATVVEKLCTMGGAIMLGKTNTDEFAMGSANLTSAFGPVKNPWRGLTNPDEARVPGGSSGGSASAVAACLASGALGSDSGGSIRQPAAFCGIVGAKPTYGRCSRFGMVAFASSLDQAGPLARSVMDCAILMDAIMGHDPRDATSSSEPINISMTQACQHSSLKGMRIGIPHEYIHEGTDAFVTDIWNKGQQWLKDAGCHIVPIHLPHTSYALACYHILASAEASSNLARYDGARFGVRANHADTLEQMYTKTRTQGFGDEVIRRILLGTYVLSHGFYDAYYRQAQKVRTLITHDFTEAFKKVDAILTPTAPFPAFPLNSPPKDPVAMYLNDLWTCSTNLAGLPAISIPAGLNTNCLPLALQVIAPAFQEAKMFSIAQHLENVAKFQPLAPL